MAVLNCDLSTIPINDFDRFQNPTSKRPYYVAYLVCKIIMSGTSIEVEIHWNKRVICSTRIRDLDSMSMRG